MQPIQQEMAQQFIDRIGRDVHSVERRGHSGFTILTSGGQQLGVVRFNVQRANRGRYTIYAYALPGTPLPDPRGRFINESTNQPPRGWKCFVDPSDAADLSCIVRVIERLYDAKQAFGQ